MTALSDVRVVRGGTALELGGRRVVRRCDLESALGAADPLASRRFVAARPEGDGLVLTFAGGDEERLPEDAFADSGARAATQRRADLIVEGAGLLLSCERSGTDSLGAIRDGSLVIGGDRILWVGPGRDLGASGIDLAGARRIDAGGRLLTPGLVDCHAHPVFAGQRAGEFERRARGDSYLEIQAAGGGIAATLAPTREASAEEHIAACAARVRRALAWGTTTMEAKSGYDLTVDGELRLLEIAWMVDALQPLDLVPTLLGAHVVPPERADDRRGYLDDVIEKMIPEAARRGLATAVDVYCDANAFRCEESREVLGAARAAGLPVKAHVGQFADIGGAELVAELGGLSADHLENVSRKGIDALAASGVVAVMLPGACVQLRMAPPPVGELRRAGVTMAIASDLNPGTSHSETLPVPMWLATTHFGMTVEEAWLGVTANAARALQRHDIGVLAPGAVADAVLWDAEIPAEIPSHFGVNLVHRVIAKGRLVPGPSGRA